MEVRGYADAPSWIYGQALNPGAWSSGELLSLTELRHIHRLSIARRQRAHWSARSNLLLVRLGYPSAIIFKGDRPRYLTALESADRGDHGPLGERATFFVRERSRG